MPRATNIFAGKKRLRQAEARIGIYIIYYAKSLWIFLVLIPKPQHEQPGGRDDDRHLHVRYLGHEKNDACHEDEAEVIRPRVKKRMEFRRVMVFHAVFPEFQMRDADSHPIHHRRRCRD